MPRALRPYNDPEYRRAKRWLKHHPGTLCWKGCGRPASSPDHQPPLKLHDHVRGSGCCRLLPACAPCNLSDGAVIGNTGRVPGRNPHARRA